MSDSHVRMQDSEIFTEEHEQIRATVRQFAKSLAPHAEEWDQGGDFSAWCLIRRVNWSFGYWSRPGIWGAGARLVVHSLLRRRACAFQQCGCEFRPPSSVRHGDSDHQRDGKR